MVAVGDAYTTWEGYKDEATGETKIGVSYAQLCKDVKEGGRILVADGAVTIQVSLLIALQQVLLGSHQPGHYSLVSFDVPGVCESHSGVGHPTSCWPLLRLSSVSPILPPAAGGQGAV